MTMPNSSRTGGVEGSDGLPRREAVLRTVIAIELREQGSEGQVGLGECGRRKACAASQEKRSETLSRSGSHDSFLHWDGTVPTQGEWGSCDLLGKNGPAISAENGPANAGFFSLSFSAE
jgi:hypothetical protein